MASPKQPRPTFFEDTANDRLTAIITALTAEVATLCDRVVTLESVLASSGAMTKDAIDNYQPTPEDMDERRKRHAAFTQRVFYVLQEEIDALKDTPKAQG